LLGNWSFARRYPSLHRRRYFVRPCNIDS
jgi:hypothetical protein